MDNSKKVPMKPEFEKFWKEAHKSGGIIHTFELNKFAELVWEAGFKAGAKEKNNNG